MALDSETLLLSIVPVLIGFSLGILSQPLAQAVINIRRRRKLAQALKSEIRAIKIAVESRIGIHCKSIEETDRSFRTSPTFIGGPEMADGDLPTGVYRSNTSDIGLFNDGLIVLLTELYNWIGYANHHRDLNMQEARDLQSFYVPRLGREVSEAEIPYARSKSGTMIHYAKAYVECLIKIGALSEESLKELNRICRKEPKYSVSATFQEPMIETFP